MVGRLDLGQRDVAARRVEPAGVPEVDPAGGPELISAMTPCSSKRWSLHPEFSAGFWVDGYSVR